MDLSGIIFAAVAVGWAVYLIPKAVQHHDEMARTRSVEDFSDRVRVHGRDRARRPARPDAAPSPSGEAAEVVEVAQRPSPDPAPQAPLPTRAAARRAARRRRRVLAVLLLATAVVGVLAWQAVLPGWAPVVPAALVLAFLVIARLSVRAEQHRRAAGSAVVEEVPQRSSGHLVDSPAAEAEVTDREDTVGVPVADLAGIADAPIPDDGALWDPLPMTLPTYVGKPRARRTVRTIELTQTRVTSSGHDAADSALARQAAAQEAEQSDAPAEPATDTPQPRAVGE